MKKEKKTMDPIRQEDQELDQLRDEVGSLEGIGRLRKAWEQMQEVASQKPPISAQQLHALIEGERLSQFQLRRQSDRYLLMLCLLVLALLASLLWHTASRGVTPTNVAVLTLAVADCWVACRAARSLWLMWQTHRLRFQPDRMSRYADRLSRLSYRRRWWLGLVLRNNAGLKHHCVRYRRRVAVCRFAVAACLVVLLVVGLLWRQPAEVGHPSQPLVAEQSIKEVPKQIEPILQNTERHQFNNPTNKQTIQVAQVFCHSDEKQPDARQESCMGTSEEYSDFAISLMEYDVCVYVRCNSICDKDTLTHECGKLV